MDPAHIPQTEPDPHTGSIAVDDAELLLALACSAGMLVVLDGQIGREKYQTVTGSLHAFQRFASALQIALLTDHGPGTRGAAVRQWPSL